MEAPLQQHSGLPLKQATWAQSTLAHQPELCRHLGEPPSSTLRVGELSVPYQRCPAVREDLTIPYVPYRRLDAGRLIQHVDVNRALVMLLRLGDHVAPVPGTSSLDHLQQLVSAVTSRERAWGLRGTAYYAGSLSGVQLAEQHGAGRQSADPANVRPVCH